MSGHGVNVAALLKGFSAKQAIEKHAKTVSTKRDKSGALDAAAASFRSQQARAAEHLDEIARQQQQRGVGGAGAKRKAAPAKSASRRGATSQGSGDGTGSGGPSTSGAPADWKAAAVRGSLPLGARIKRVLDFLRRCDQPQTQRQISVATELSLSADRHLKEALAVNPKVELSPEGLYTYRPEVANVRNREQLLAYLRRRHAVGEGYASWKDLEDSYADVAADMEVLKREGLVIGLYSHAPELECEVYYPVDQRLAAFKVHEDVQLLWQTIQVPEDEDEVQEELRKLRLRPAPRKAPRKREKRDRAKKPRRPPRLRAVTNVHLMELLQVLPWSSVCVPGFGVIGSGGLGGEA
eukprot:scaffold23.g4140.t1